MQPGYSDANVTPVLSWKRRCISRMVSMLHTLLSLYACARACAWHHPTQALARVAVRYAPAAPGRPARPARPAHTAPAWHDGAFLLAASSLRLSNRELCQGLAGAPLSVRLHTREGLTAGQLRLNTPGSPRAGRLALAPSKSRPSIMADVPSPRPLARPLMSPRLALGGMLPASVLVLPARARAAVCSSLVWTGTCHRAPVLHGWMQSQLMGACRRDSLTACRGCVPWRAACILLQARAT
jgi:hypothetical protein